MKLFLSYSRQELYFAEAVAQKLLDAGFDVWFDIQQLESGIDWKKAIDDGLANCDAMVLVASQAALHSPYVAIEWQRIFDSGKPVYVLVSENVSFEGDVTFQSQDAKTNRVMRLADLRANAACIIDCRTAFDKNVQRLIDCLQKGEKHADPIPEPLPLHLSSRLPRTVAIVALALGLNVVTILFLTFKVFSVFISGLLAGLVLSSLLGYQLLEFLWRSFCF